MHTHTHTNSNKVWNLGKPSYRYPPTELDGKNGILLKYVEGDLCDEDTTRFSTSLLLVCNRNIPVVSGCGWWGVVIILYISEDKRMLTCTYIHTHRVLLSLLRREIVNSFSVGRAFMHVESIYLTPIPLKTSAQ